MGEIILINDDKKLEGHFVKTDTNKVEFRRDNLNYNAEISETDDPKVFEVLLKGKTYTIGIKTKLDELISEMGLNVIEAKDAGDIYSPMPGLVLDILVKDGEMVEDGQALAILEAMKMENIIKSAGEGKVEGISIQKGDKVEKGQLLISIKPQE